MLDSSALDQTYRMSDNQPTAADVISGNKFAKLKSHRRTWAVAAIHGEAERLRALHRELDGRLEAGENLVYLGNFLGRGDGVCETIEELLLFRRAFLARPGVHNRNIAFLRGSQEEMWQKLLQVQLAPNPRQVLEWMFEHGAQATLAVYGGSPEDGLTAAGKGTVALTEWTSELRDAMRTNDGHNALMSVLKHAAFTSDGTLLFVPAGIDTTRPLSEQGDSFWWGGHDFHKIETPYSGFRRVIRGFAFRRHGVDIREVTATVDGGCGFGGPLVAVCFDGTGEVADMIEA